MDYEVNILEKVIELGYNPDDITPEQEMALRMSIRQIVDVAYSECKRLAQERLHGKRIDYLKALKLMPAGSDGYRIELGENMVEFDEGFSGFDMKPGLLRGPHAKISKDGVPYNIVPIKGSSEYHSAGKTEFKVVSGKSDKNSWIHPGYGGAHILDDVFYYLDSEIENIITNILGE